MIEVERENVSAPRPRWVRSSLLAATPVVLAIVGLVGLPFWDAARGWKLATESPEHRNGLVFVALGIGVYMIAETRRRARLGVARLPWFSFAAIALLAGVFWAPVAAHPLVLLNPDWCRVSQTARWSEPLGRCNFTASGPGNEAQHAFEIGSLSGPDCLGVPLIRFQPLRLIGPQSADESAQGPAAWPTVAATQAEQLRPYLAEPEQTPEQLDALAKSVWDVLQQANAAQPLASAAANVEPIAARVKSLVEGLVGAAIWSALTVLVFLIVGRATLTSPTTPAQRAAP